MYASAPTDTRAHCQEVLSNKRRSRTPGGSTALKPQQSSSLPVVMKPRRFPYWTAYMQSSFRVDQTCAPGAPEVRTACKNNLQHLQGTELAVMEVKYVT